MQDRAERTRNAILDAAAEVFDKRGFNGANLSDILAKAGVTKGALYFHFASKEELARAIIEEQWAWDPPPLDEGRSIQTLIGDPKKVSLWIGGAFLGIQTMSEVLTGRVDIHGRVTELWAISLPGIVPPRRLSRFIPSGTVKWETSGAA